MDCGLPVKLALMMTNIGANMITIQEWCTLLPTPVWRVQYRLSWQEYVAMSKWRVNEGTQWKATF